MSLLLVSGIYFYFLNSSIEKELQELGAKEVSQKKDIEYSESRIRTLSNEIPSKRIEIESLKKNLVETKKNLDPSKLKPVTGYTVKSYSTRQGNRTYSKNYIYFK